MDEPLLRLVDISKRFGNTVALDGVSLQVDRGEVISLVGENGAGKSTLMKVLAGIVHPDGGTVRMAGQICRWACPGDAIRAGIALIHQEISLHEHLTVAENIFLGREPKRGSGRLGWFGSFGWLDRPAILASSGELLERVGLSISPKTLVSELPLASKQLVEIARALSVEARVVVMDEPTSSLSDDEADRLMRLIGRLKNEGVAVIYISHRLPEVIRISDRIEVLRDGKHVRTLLGDQVDHDTLVKSMVGRELAQRQPSSRIRSRVDTLVVDQLRVGSRSAPAVSFTVGAGEVVALVGLVGAGRTEIIETIFGIRPRLGGSVSVDGRVLRGNIAESIQNGIALVPEDRKQAGLLIESNVRDNATIVAMGRSPSHANRHIGWPERWLAGTFISRSWQSTTADQLIQRLRVKTASNQSPIASLSGGNQQKVALAKWLPLDLSVLMLDEPTRGVDVGAKAEIYELIDGLARDGLAVVVVSSEMEEVFAIADRVLVVSQGKIAGELSREELSEEAIMHLAVTQR